MAKKIRVEAGQKVRFDPFEEDFGIGVVQCRGLVTGTVVEIHTEHQWFSVEFGDPKQRISFKFCDIGKSVIIVG